MGFTRERRDVFTIPPANNQVITLTGAGRAFHDIRALTAPAEVTTGVSAAANGITVAEAGFYSVVCQVSFEYIASVAGEWGISLLRTNGLTGAEEVIHESEIESATVVVSGSGADHIVSLGFPVSYFRGRRHALCGDQLRGGGGGNADLQHLSESDHEHDRAPALRG